MSKRIVIDGTKVGRKYRVKLYGHNVDLRPSLFRMLVLLATEKVLYPPDGEVWLRDLDPYNHYHYLSQMKLDIKEALKKNPGRQWQVYKTSGDGKVQLRAKPGDIEFNFDKALKFPDIVTANKKGVFYFEQRRVSTQGIR